MKTTHFYKIVSMALAAFILSGCMQLKPTFTLKYTPYDFVGYPEKELYNIVFNEIEANLVSYVKQTMIAYTDPLGVIVELGSSVHTEQFDVIMKGKALQGWKVFNPEIAPFSSDEYTEYNAGKMSSEICNRPTGAFYIQFDGGRAKIYISYIIKNYGNYNFILTAEKSILGWTITDRKTLK